MLDYRISFLLFNLFLEGGIGGGGRSVIHILWALIFEVFEINQKMGTMNDGGLAMHKQIKCESITSPYQS